MAGIKPQPKGESPRGTGNEVRVGVLPVEVGAADRIRDVGRPVDVRGIDFQEDGSGTRLCRVADEVRVRVLPVQIGATDGAMAGVGPVDVG